MTRYAGLTLILFLLMNLSCGYNSNIIEDQNYTPPTQINHPRILYPRIAQENSHSGSATVLFEITKKGNVADAVIVKTSGSDALDNSALEYCHGLLFEPAKVNGKPINIKMTKELKFRISKMDMEANNYVMDIKRLYSFLEYADPSVKLILERQILQKHIEFIGEMKDALNFNSYSAEVLSSKVLSEWKKDWDSWPLSFLLFHDFIQRYPDYDSLQYVKKLLYRALNYDIKYINNTANSGPGSITEKENILSKIMKFVSVNYPDYKLNDTEIENSNENAPVSLSANKIKW